MVWQDGIDGRNKRKASAGYTEFEVNGCCEGDLIPETHYEYMGGNYIYI